MAALIKTHANLNKDELAASLSLDWQKLKFDIDVFSDNFRASKFFKKEQNCLDRVELLWLTITTGTIDHIIGLTLDVPAKVTKKNKIISRLNLLLGNCILPYQSQRVRHFLKPTKN